MKYLTHQSILFILRICCITLFAGRAWQHLFWDAPFRSLLWDEALLSGVVEWLLNVSWYEYATSSKTDQTIRYLIRACGAYYFIMMLISIFITRQNRLWSILYWVSTCFLAFLAMLYCKEKFYHVGQFFEYAIQVMTPISFYYFLRPNAHANKKWLIIMKVCVALTFISHGLYAWGVYPRPGVFVDMTIAILQVPEQTAHVFLRWAGFLDFVVGVGIFLPRVSRYCLGYCIFWGLLTALARTVANVEGGFLLSVLHQNLPDTIYRLPHSLFPLACLLLQQRISFRNSKLANSE